MESCDERMRGQADSKIPFECAASLATLGKKQPPPSQPVPESRKAIMLGWAMLNTTKQKKTGTDFFHFLLLGMGDL